MTMEQSTVLKMYDVSPIKTRVTFLLAMLSFQEKSSTFSSTYQAAQLHSMPRPPKMAPAPA